ncbi:hypothetical protein BsWGS_25745 [Bradybaena similaris]
MSSQTESTASAFPPTSDKNTGNNKLVIGLAVGIPLFLLLAVGLFILAFLWRRKKRRSDSSTSGWSHFDEEYRSPFAQSIATRSSWNEGRIPNISGFNDPEKPGVRIPWENYATSLFPEGEEFKIERPRLTLNFGSQL